MYCSQKFIEKPIQLLSFDSLGHAILHPQALAFIQSLSKPISIVCIAGPYRTGKSYLLNELIGSKVAFEVGASIRSMTKGVWIWGKPILSVDENGEITNVLIIDTEGFGSFEEQYDNRILTFALLLSNCFIYNSKGAIDKQSLCQLEYVVSVVKKLKQEIHCKSATDFHWVLRDFHLKLVNELDLPITSNQYMEKCIAECGTIIQELVNTFKTYFRDRYCHTFANPFLDGSDEQKPEFTEQILKFKKILQGIPSLSIDGFTLSEMLEAYASAMNENYPSQRILQEGIECKIRLQCLSRLYESLKNVPSVDSRQKRDKKIFEIKKNIQEYYSTKMTSLKQIQMLEYEIDEIIVKYEESNVIQAKSREKEPRPSIRVNCRSKQLRSSLAVVDDLVSERTLKSTNKIQLIAYQKMREQFEAKIHRLQLELSSQIESNQQLEDEVQNLLKKKQTLEQSSCDWSSKLLKRQNSFTEEKMKLEEEFIRLKKQKLITQSELEKLKELSEQKIAYLEERLAEAELAQKEEFQTTIIRYKNQASFFQKENEQLIEKHNREIAEMKKFYRFEESTNEQLKIETNPKTKNLENELSQYRRIIEQTKQENEKLKFSLSELENKLSVLDQEHEQFKQASIIKFECLEKRHKQSELHLAELYEQKLKAKDAMIEDISAKLGQINKQKSLETEEMVEKESERQKQISQLMQRYEAELEQMREECISAHSKQEIAQSLLAQKEVECELVKRQVDDLHFQTQKLHQKLRECLIKEKDLEEINKQLELKHMNECDQFRELIEQLQNDIEAEQKQKVKIREEHTYLQDIEAQRNQQKLKALSAALAQYKNAEEKYENLKVVEENSRLEILDLEEDIKMLEQNIRALKSENEMMKEKNQRQTDVIKQQKKQIKEMQGEMSEVLSQKANENSDRESKYFQLLSKLHEREKQCYLAIQEKEGLTKELLSKQKQMKSSAEIMELAKQKLRQMKDEELASIKTKLKQVEQSSLNATRQLLLAEQKCGYLQKQVNDQDEHYRASKEKQEERFKTYVEALEKKMSKLESLYLGQQEKCKFYSDDLRETIEGYSELKRRYDKHCSQYENNTKILRKKILDLEKENKFLQAEQQRLVSDIQIVCKAKQMIQHNYNEDFKLWANKINAYQQHFKQITQ